MKTKIRPVFLTKQDVVKVRLAMPALERLLLVADQLHYALDLLARAAKAHEDGFPDDNKWFRDYFALMGIHMVLTDEGWEPGENKDALIFEHGSEVILDEVNAPIVIGAKP